MPAPTATAGDPTSIKCAACGCHRNFHRRDPASNHHHHHHLSSRKRFRTKFTQEQKEKMHVFAERVGWKIQKRDEDLIQEFCHEVGVDRGVLKVWMHNNKNTFGKREREQGNTKNVLEGPGINGADDDNNNNNKSNGLNGGMMMMMNGGDGSGHDDDGSADANGAGTNGSSSSS
ncbi:hypothetical protein Ahy_B10g105497 isoform A [Arachis hypogaea]|uniref:ZF-HD dimerization-type domain-containing protein n=1 Tax=Arachis hypogaea TaxID=3818 RepID=A0A444X844_ARAHY|nr:hypothetical protein Ahy_B10g105497 isoform A [Arachis hypogaea]